MIARARAAGIEGTRVDALLAIAIALELEIEVWLDAGIPASHRPLTALAAAIYAAPVAARRRRPATALVTCMATLLAQALLGIHLEVANGVLLPPVVLAYSAGAWLDLRRGLGALAVAVGLLGAFLAVSDPATASPGGIATGAFFVTLLLGVPWLLGRVAQERSRRIAGFALLADRTAAEHDERERAVTAQERDRIGVELQDIIAHSVSAMVIQAGGARQLLRSDPERARESILAVELAGRETLADLRRLLGLLRKDDDRHALSPQPGLGSLAALIRSTQDSGLACVLETEGEPVDLALGVDLVAYRIVEAALACATEHRSRAAFVTVRYQPRSLRLVIRANASAPDLQNELGSLPERVALYAGELRTLSAEDGGFIVQARLPVGASVPA